jgi:hypothetical protein
MVQLRVSFTLPQHSFGVKAVKVFLLFEAESEEAVAALQQFAFESFGTKLTEISHFCCEEVKSKCENVLLQAGDVYLVLDMLMR